MFTIMSYLLGFCAGALLQQSWYTNDMIASAKRGNCNSQLERLKEQRREQIFCAAICIAVAYQLTKI